MIVHTRLCVLILEQENASHVNISTYEQAALDAWNLSRPFVNNVSTVYEFDAAIDKGAAAYKATTPGGKEKIEGFYEYIAHGCSQVFNPMIGIPTPEKTEL